MEPELKRLRRLLIISWMILIMTIAGFSFWASYQIHYVRYRITQVASVQPLQGIQGKQGPKGVPGIDAVGIQGPAGLPGQNALSTVMVQPIYSNIPIPGPQGPAGATGATGKTGTTGASGRELELCKMADNSLGQRYVGTSECQLIEGPNDR